MLLPEEARRVPAFFHKTGLRVNPNRKSRAWRAIWASSRGRLISRGLRNACRTARSVICVGAGVGCTNARGWNLPSRPRDRTSVKVTRRTGRDPISFFRASCTCQAIASPSRSGSVARTSSRTPGSACRWKERLVSKGMRDAVGNPLHPSDYKLGIRSPGSCLADDLQGVVLPLPDELELHGKIVVRIHRSRLGR